MKSKMLNEIEQEKREMWGQIEGRLTIDYKSRTVLWFASLQDDWREGVLLHWNRQRKATRATNAKPIEIWIWQRWLLVVCQLTIIKLRTNHTKKFGDDTPITVLSMYQMETNRRRTRGSYSRAAKSQPWWNWWYSDWIVFGKKKAHISDCFQILLILVRVKASLPPSLSLQLSTTPHEFSKMSFLSTFYYSPMGNEWNFQTWWTTDHNNRNNSQRSQLSSLVSEVRKMFQWIISTHPKKQ